MICNCCGASVPDAPFCCQCGTPQKPMTLGALHESWKKVHYRRIGKKGIEGYETAWRVLGVLADKPVVSLTLEDYQAVMDSIAEYSFSKQQKLRQLISQLCQYAQIRKIDTSNYAPFLILDGYRSKSRLILSDEEINRLFFYAVSAKGKYWEAAQITLILVLTGMRPEELFEVKKADVDLAAGKIYTAGSKTEAGRDRTIPIAQPIAPFLLYLTLRHPDCPYLVTSPNQFCITPGSTIRRTGRKKVTCLISTKINFEITEYHEKIFAGLSIRQLVCFGIAIVLAVATFAVGIYYFGATADTLSYIVMIEVVPFLGFGFIRRNGYPFEKLVAIYWRNMSESHQIPVRPFKECYQNDSAKKSRKRKTCECQAASSLTKKEIKGRAAQTRKSIARAKKDTRKEQRAIRKANKEKARAAKGQ